MPPAPTVTPTGRRRRAAPPGLRAIVSVLVVLLITAALIGTRAAFSDTAGNSGNSLTAGTVLLSDNDTGVAAFDDIDLDPGESANSCITVTYAGDLDAVIRLYAATGGSGLADNLTLTVTRGSGGGL